MQNRNRGRYEIAGSEVVAEGDDMRVSVLTLAAGQEVPWHYHSEITDSFVCLEGPMVVETRAPRHAYRLEPGQRCAVAAEDRASCAGRRGRPVQIPDRAGRRDLRFRPGRLTRFRPRLSGFTNRSRRRPGPIFHILNGDKWIPAFAGN